MSMAVVCMYRKSYVLHSIPLSSLERLTCYSNRASNFDSLEKKDVSWKPFCSILWAQLPHLGHQYSSWSWDPAEQNFELSNSKHDWFRINNPNPIRINHVQTTLRSMRSLEKVIMRKKGLLSQYDAFQPAWLPRQLFSRAQSSRFIINWVTAEYNRILCT